MSKKKEKIGIINFIPDNLPEAEKEWLRREQYGWPDGYEKDKEAKDILKVQCPKCEKSHDGDEIACPYCAYLYDPE
ncbi:MAG: hypothetical protein V3U54_13300 [Thermodesulfobacteriota bacterium]